MLHRPQGGFSAIAAAIIALLILGAGVVIFVSRPTLRPTTGEPTPRLGTPEPSNEVADRGETSFTPSVSPIVSSQKSPVAPVIFSGTVLAGTSSPLLEYTKADYERAVQSDKLVVLYFYANWCPFCKEEFPKMRAAFDELNTSAVVGFRVNYNDNETDRDEESLARTYGVVYQHTKVFVKNGNEIFRSPETWDTDRYRTEIRSRVSSE